MPDLDAYLTPQVTAVAVALLVAFSIAGLLYAFLQPRLSGANRQEARIREISARSSIAAERAKHRDADRRRKTVQDQLKDFEDRQKKKKKNAEKIGLEARLKQAGLAWSLKKFWFISFIVGLLSVGAGTFASKSPYIIAAFGFIGMFGLPRWFVNRKRRRRFEAFLHELPNAVDVIVRGAKSGLPVGECIQIVAREAREPVAGEFRRIIEMQALGVSLPEAVAKLPERIPLAEANFFAIVIGIQQQSGGALSEALGNLSKVLRSRKTMKGKIRAMSTEAKSSAAIIGSLPVFVVTILTLTSPDYIGLLFTNSTGNLIIIFSLIWMGLGIFVMKKMINFDF